MPSERAAVAPGLPPALVAALVAPSGLAFCQALRRFYYTELDAGHVPAAVLDAEAAGASTAGELDLLGPAGPSGERRLTPFGYEVANVAKEYANWADAGRRLPDGITPPLVAGKRVLDVGCSFGRHLLGMTLHGARGVGIELQDTYLRLSRVFAAQLGIGSLAVARARAEHLPFRTASFDVVFCRLVINYVEDIDHTLGEFARVLAPGGTLVLVVDPPAVPLRHLWRSRWFSNGRAVAFTLFGLLNTALLEAGGRQLVLRRPGRMHARQSPAWPTTRWFVRRLAAHGFVPLHGESQAVAGHAGLYQARLRGTRLPTV